MARYGHARRALERCGSTNDEAFAWALQGAPDGAVVTAREQLTGRGRAGRAWHSPPGDGLYLSLIVRPKIPPAEAPGLSFAAAVAAAEALSPFLPKPPLLKWPNDIFYEGKKLGGILLGMSTSPEGRLDFVVIGIGVNVNTTAFPEELGPIATSLRLASGRRRELEEVAEALLERLEARVELLAREGFGPIRELWRARAFTLGRRVALERPPARGIARDIDLSGALLVEADSGELLTVVAGDVVHLEGPGD
jgi:BirA family transcriptional regulator, biotin operon repressor / biotin---[acetyl-CoA-carboxylase] ligase